MLSPARRRFPAGRSLLLVVLALVAGLGATAPPALASEGTFTQILCADPDTGRGVMGSDGILPAGLRDHRIDHPNFGHTQRDTRCSGTMTGLRGVVLSTGGAIFTYPPADSGLIMRYEPAAGVGFDSGVVYRQSQMGSGWDDYWSIGINRAYDDWQWADPQYDMCVSRWSENCRGRGSTDPFSAGNRVDIGRAAGLDAGGRPLNGFNLLIKCAGGNCSADGGDFLRVFGGRLALTDETSPRLDGAPTGALAGDGPVQGTVDASFRVTDAGSGVYRTRLVIDGVARPWQSAHPNGGLCQDIDASDGDLYEFSTSAPCRGDVDGSIALDTRTVADGMRTIRLEAEDAAGNVATLLNNQVVVDNVPAPSSLSAPALTGVARDGSSLETVAGEWDDHGAEGDIAVTRRWQVCDDDGEDCADVDDDRVAGPSLLLDDGDVGATFRVLEIAVNTEGETRRASEPSAVVADLPAPSNGRLPGVLGGARRGNVLVAQAGGWDDHEAAGDPVVARQWQRCRYDGTQCADVPGATGSVFELGTADLNRRIQLVETATNAEGTGRAVSAQTPKVMREDGTLPPDNNGEDDDGDGAVDEPGETPPSAGSGTGASGAGATSGSDGAAGANGKDGAAGSTVSTTSATSSSTVVRNGENASRSARLVVSFRDGNAGVMTVGFGKGAVIVGRLVDESGRPISGAAIDVAHTTAVRGAAASTRPGTVTDAAGRFTYVVERRTTSGTVRFAYSYARGEQPVAVDEVDLRVRAALRFVVKLKGVVASYRGQVTSGPVPRGKLVVLQGRVKGRAWQTFASRRAAANGRFSGRYRLKVRVPGRKLQFRARVLAESGFPYLTGTSRPITRTVR